MSSTDRSETVVRRRRDAASRPNDGEGSFDIARGFLAQRTRDTGFGAVRTYENPLNGIENLTIAPRAMNGSKEYG